MSKSKKDSKKHETREKKKKCMTCSISKDNLITIGIILAIIVIFALVMNIDKIFPGEDKPEVIEGEEGVLAYVNGATITQEMVDAEIARLPEYYQQMGTDLQKAILDELIARELLLQDGETKGIAITDEDVDEYINNFLTENEMTLEELEAQLSQNGASLEDTKEQLKSSLLVNKIAEGLQSEVTDEAIEEFFNTNKDSLIQMHASHILVCWEGKSNCAEERTQEEAEAIVAEIQEKLNAGEDFAELAEEYSDGPSATAGGDLGWFGKGQMVPEFEAATFALNVGEISEPTETDFGLHIIMLSESKNSLDDFKDTIAEQLSTQGLQDALMTYVETLKEAADIQYVEQPETTATVETTETTTTETATEGTFAVKSDAEICTEDGKPVIYLFSTTWCPHCKWITETFESTVQEYVDAGQIVARHWEIDINDDTLTDEAETEVPAEQLAVYKEFNPGGSIPTFVFGCKYSRIGNGYEQQQDLEAEESEFRAVIEKLLEEVA